MGVRGERGVSVPAAVTSCCRRRGRANRPSLLTALEAEKSEVRVSARQGLMRVLFLAVSPHGGKRGKEGSCHSPQTSVRDTQCVVRIRFLTRFHFLSP